MIHLLARYFQILLCSVVPGRWRGHILARFGIIKHCGRGGLFCTTRIGTEPYLISIGDHTIIASDVMFINHDMSVTSAARFLGKGEVILIGEITIGSNCFIGARAILLPGITICDGAIVGAGSIVRNDILEPGIYVGVGPRKVAELGDHLEHAIQDSETRHRDLAERYPKRFRMDGNRISKR